MPQPIEIALLSDRHFWHGGYDKAYARSCNRFFAWCEDRGLTPATIRPHDVGTYIEQLQQQVSRRRRSSSSSPRSA